MVVCCGAVGDVAVCCGAGRLPLMSIYRLSESRVGGDIGDPAGVLGFKDIPLSCSAALSESHIIYW